MIFFQPMENSFNIACSADLLAVYSINFCSYENVFILHIFGRFFSSGLEFLIHSILFQNIKDVTPMSSGLCFLFYFLFIYFWLHWVFIVARRLSLVAVSRGYSLLQCTGFPLRWLLLLRNTGSRHAGFSSCGTWA